MKSSNTNIILISLLALANVFVIGVYGYLFYQIYGEQGKTEAELANLETELKREASLGDISNILATTAEEQKKINEYFVDIKGTAGFLEFLRDLGNEAGVDLRLSGVDVEGKNTLRVNFTANGTFKSLYLLNALLKATPYPITISSLNMSKVQIKESGKNNLIWSGSYEIRLLSFINK